MKVYIPILYFKYPEDGEDILDVYYDEEEAKSVAEDEVENGHHTRYSVLERELIDG